MRVLVTGGSGYIGRHVVLKLLERGHSVVATTHRSSDFPPEVTQIPFDIGTSTANLFSLAGKPDVCIHLAWANGFSHADPSHLQRAYEHLAFIKGLFEAGLRHIAIAGTMHEVGYHVGVVTADTPMRPLHSYGLGKSFLHQAVTMLASSLDVRLQWLRFYYILGDDIRNRSVFSKLLEVEKSGKRTFEFNSGELLYDFIDVGQLANQVVAVASQREIDGVINCCSGKPRSLKSAVLSFIADNSLAIEPVWGKYPLRRYDSPAIWGDSRAIEAIMERDGRA